MDIGIKIKKLRLKYGITQGQLAEYLNVSMQTVSRWETSVTYPDITILPILAKQFHVTVDYLLDIGGINMKTIESQNLIIRPWENSDAQELFEIKQKSNNFASYLSFTNVNDSLDCIKIWEEYHEMYPIILKETNQLIGVVGLIDINRYKGYNELEIYLTENYSNDKIFAESIKMILNYGFNELNLSVVCAYCQDEDITLSQSFMKLGFTCEGILRKFGRDMKNRTRYSILKEEFN